MSYTIMAKVSGTYMYYTTIRPPHYANWLSNWYQHSNRRCGPETYPLVPCYHVTLFISIMDLITGLLITVNSQMIHRNVTRYIKTSVIFKASLHQEPISVDVTSGCMHAWKYSIGGHGYCKAELWYEFAFWDMPQVLYHSYTEAYSQLKAIL